ncbi:PREDICTED: protein LURP-one-related 8-like [Tarenaya hassleriana]|uniref:protein LURP-one-related 8-like n=1 Tax=Tarenaya hassleriana TaxID=28532 RepID=UPI00053C5EA4|nr:PREDICTED: protein LURP-one-related 8-like [Tarenaya hassleriana]
MTKVYPKGEAVEKASTSATTELTVWKKSLLFNCNGFTVFDPKGDLIFRVDNYMEGHRGQTLLMDAAGKPLLTIRRKRKLSLGDCWVVCDGETTSNPLFSMRKNVSVLNSKSLAYASKKGRAVLYEVEGSYGKRCCTVYDGKRRKMAEVRSKEAAGGVNLGYDVFRLIVHPGLDTATAMSLVILLDQMFRS